MSTWRGSSLAPPAIGRSLPPDLELVAVRRLGSLCLALTGTMLVATVIRSVAVARGAALAPHVVAMANVASGAVALTGLGLYFYSRRSRSPKTVLHVGLVFEILLCFTLAHLELSLIDLTHPQLRLSFIALVMVTFPLVVPAVPILRVVTTIACALTLPLAFYVETAGHPVDVSTTDLSLLFAPTFVSAGLTMAVVPIVHRLNRDAAKARQLGAYELVERIGQGAMGEVWRARHVMLARPAAVKLIRPDMLGTDAVATRLRFEREAKATSALGSPHTVAVYDFGVADDGTFFYVMELLDGWGLDTLVKEHGPVAPARVIHILDQACRSLGDAHDSGLVHRDVKPANLFLCKKGNELDWVKVLDFGLVKTLVKSAGDELMLSKENTIAGTPAFMSPEAALTGIVDARSDLYSLGCVGYYLLTGSLVFDGATPMEVAVKHVKDDPRAPSSVVDQPIPEALDRVILACLAKSPDARPASAAELRARLLAIDIPRWTEADALAWWKSNPRVRASEGGPAWPSRTPPR